jgi:hypothetical protein
VRLDNQGTADPAFGESGIVTLDATGAAVAIRADEARINVAGGDETLFVASLDPDGSVLALNTIARTKPARIWSPPPVRQTSRRVSSSSS